MAENNEFIPTLTLEPDLEAAAIEIENIEDSAASAAAREAEREANAVRLDLSQLSEAEQKAVLEFAEKIDITNSNMVMQYGAGAQKNVADFSGATLRTVRTKDLGEVGGMLADLVVELKGFNYDAEEKKGFLGLFKKAQNSVASLKAEYDKAEVNVDKIVGMLEEHQVTLLKDVAMLDKMYDKNQTYFKELTMYILAGKQKLESAKNVELVALRDKAEASQLPEDAQAANDYANLIDRFEKKLHDLELTRMVSVQMAPQIRLLQNNDTLMVEKIQSSIVNTIPLWKSQMVLALGLAHSQQAMKAQREVTNLTNDLLLKNSEILKTGSIEVAKESERGIVDIETLKKTNENLINTLDEVRRIQEEGSAKRAAASEELAKIEGELKQKLLEMSK